MSEKEGAMNAQWYSHKFLAKTDTDQLQKKLQKKLTTENTQTAITSATTAAATTTTTHFLMYR